MTRQLVIGALGLAMAWVGGLGCHELPEVAYETERFEVAPDFDAPICAGSLAYLDEQLGWIEGQLGRELPEGERIRLYWMAGELDRWCSETSTGCYFPGTRVIFANSQSVAHEMVHAVLDAEAHTSLFLEEGLAELYSGVGVVNHARQNGEGGLESVVWLSPGDYRRGQLDYALAAHFVAFVEREYGSIAVRRFIDAVVSGQGPDHLDSELQRVADVSFAELEASYEASSRDAYRGLRDADVPLLEADRDVDISLACDSASTYGPLPSGQAGMYRTMRLVLDASSWVEVELIGPPELRVDFIDVARERQDRPVPDYFHPILADNHTHPRVLGGQRQRLRLRGGTHLLLISRPSYVQTDAQIVVHRLPDPE